MQEVIGPSIERTERRRLVLQVMLICCTVLVGELALASVDAIVPGPTPAGSYLAVASGAAMLGAVAVGVWMRYHNERRVRRLLEVAQGWLRGTLSLRIGERAEDRLGLLADQLDILAEHLQQDERDLSQLRERSMRQTDQIRALAVDEERERLARELHDGVKQHLFSLSMTASALCARMETGAADAELLEMAREVEKTSGTVQRTLTRLVADLRPTPLQEQGLAAALNDYALLFGAREHILVYMDVQGNDALLSPSVAETLYRVAQEALHNVARHARATRVEVSLRCLPEQTILVVEDDELVRELTRAILQKQGYKLLMAPDAIVARRLAEEHPRPIDLLLTDVILPGMSGPNLADELASRYPRLRVLFMSGYPDSEIQRYNGHGLETQLLLKPFHTKDLTSRVRSVLAS